MELGSKPHQLVNNLFFYCNVQLISNLIDLKKMCCPRADCNGNRCKFEPVFNQLYYKLQTINS